ncbi:DUF2607 domain-containing protein [Vibrio sp. J1-1]|uniref:DUF2607 family protein n=1 Tax=Vibrio sp. J1-1 TaxID=2912251 RepID=UPI001F17397C|nr:DUF2607 family protein [Vibrio sp. J1-1]MCF7481984.1 DUF2607 domain-containing protein [Vibrio sp. J1-1]
MVLSRQTTFQHCYRTVVLFSTALLIVWNFASLFHQLDVTPEHHTHHHCQMFAGTHHGLAKALPTITAQTYTRLKFHDVAESSLHTEKVHSSARAPPDFAHLSSTQNI